MQIENFHTTTQRFYLNFQYIGKLFDSPYLIQSHLLLCRGFAKLHIKILLHRI